MARAPPLNEEVLRRIVDDFDVRKRIAIDQQQVGQHAFLDDPGKCAAKGCLALLVTRARGGARAARDHGERHRADICV
jgi:hypothetical protein